MEDQVDRLIDLDVLRQVVGAERRSVAAQVLDVLKRPRLEVVDADHPVAVGYEGVAQVRFEKAGSPGLRQRSACRSGCYRRSRRLGQA